MIDDINILTEILCEIPLEYFKVKIEDSFGCNKISIKPLNISIEKITDGLIEEKLSNMIVNEFNKILNNQSIQGIAYEIYLTKKIVNSKKFGKNLFKVNYVKNISDFNYNKTLDNNLNYVFCQKNFYGRNYDILFLLNKRLIFTQISIFKSLKDLKAVINSFSLEFLFIKKKITDLNYEVDNCELFFIFNPDSNSISKCIKYSIPYIVFDPNTNKIFSDNRKNEIDDFPSFFNSKYQFIQKLNFIFDHFLLNSNIIAFCNVKKHLNNDEEKFNSTKIEFKIEKIFELNNFKINFSKIKSKNSICFLTDEYIIIPRKKIKIYKIQENNFANLIGKDKKEEIISRIFNVIFLCRLESLIKQGSEIKFLSKKRKLAILESLIPK